MFVQVSDARSQTVPSRKPYTTLMRVRLTSATVDAARIESAVAVDIRLLGNPRVLRSLDRIPSTTIQSTDTGLQIGSLSIPATRIELVPQSSPAIWIDDHQYRGSIRVMREKDGRLQIINVVELEDYIASVVDSEMPIEFGESARQAQAIAARTYALYHKARAIDRSFDVYATTRSQRYLGFQFRKNDRRLAGESEGSREIAAETAGLMCTFENHLMCTYYSAVCGGRTVRGTDVFSDADAPLRPVACEWCRASPLYRWTKDFELAQVESRIQKHATRGGIQLGAIQSVRVETTVTQPPKIVLHFSDGQQSHGITTVELRQAILPDQLPSSRLAATIENGKLVLNGRGHGHGVGLCQWGARGLSREGRNCLQILAHYYPGSKVVRLVQPD